MKLECIVAMSENRVIGKGNQLPWHISDDLKYFKKVTMGKAILMGRKTHESIGRPLPGRTNVVLTSDPAYVAPGCVVVNSIDEALQVGEALESLVVMGGQTIYEQFIDKVEVLYITLVHTEIEGDAFFPDIDFSSWSEQVVASGEPNEKNDFGFTFKTYTKRKMEFNKQTGTSL